MNYEIRSLLTPFYLGSIDDKKRLLVERELLTDTEILVEFLDLKREREAAEPIPRGPSNKLWFRLLGKIEPRKRVIFSLSIGVAAAAAVLLCAMFISRSERVDKQPTGESQVLIDSSRELSGSADVL